MIWPAWLRTVCFWNGTRPVKRRGWRSTSWTLEALEDRQLLTIQFLFDYSYDTSGFFADVTRRDLVQQAGDALASRLNDTLLSIQAMGSNTWQAVFANPSTGQQTSLSNLFVPANSLVVFVGARDLGTGQLAEGGPGGFSVSGDQAWRDRVEARGQGGALALVPTDFGPWGGTLVFDNVGTQWHYSASTSGLAANEVDFLSVAQHELGHLLGMGTSDSWWRWVVGGAFTGPKSQAAYDLNGNPPLSPDRSHWANGTQDGGQETAMDPSLVNGTRKLFTGLDYAALFDIGWNITSPASPYGVTVTPTTTLTTSESGVSASFNVVLKSAPTSTVTIQLSASDSSEGTLGTTLLTFTPQNWSTPQTVTVYGADDDLDDGNQNYSIITSNTVSADSNYNGLTVDDLAVVNLDDDLTGISVTPISGLVTNEAGGQSSFTIVLTTQPTANVTIPLSSSNTREGRVSVNQVLFTPSDWSTPRVVTVTGVNDATPDGNTQYSIVTGAAISLDAKYHGMNASDVSVINLALADIPPIVSLPGDDPSYRKDNVAVQLDKLATIQDPDSPFLSLDGARLTVTVANHRTSSDRLEITGSGAGTGVTMSSDGVSVRYNGVTVATRSGGSSTPLVVRFNSRATMAAVQAVLRSVTFRTTSSNTSDLTRTVTVQFATADGTASNLASKNVTVMTGRSPPEVKLSEESLSYSNRSGAQVIDSGISLTDLDSINFSGGKVTVSLIAGAQLGDMLQIRREGIKVGQIDAKNGTIKFSGRAIATWSGGKDGRPLVITLKSTATLAGVQALLRNLTFETSGTNTSLAQRQVSITVSDGDGGVSVPAIQQIDVVGGGADSATSTSKARRLH